MLGLGLARAGLAQIKITCVILRSTLKFINNTLDVKSTPARGGLWTLMRFTFSAPLTPQKRGVLLPKIY